MSTGSRQRETKGQRVEAAGGEEGAPLPAVENWD